MGTTSSAIFTGSSQFSTDFQNVITRAVQIASLPMNQLTTEKTDFSNQSTALAGLDTAFKSLQSKVSSIETAMGTSALQATPSDPTKLTATLGDGAMAGVYSVKIVDQGTYATSITKAEDYSGTHDFKLSINGQVNDLTVTDSTASGVASAINSSYGGQVQATVVNVGSAAAPDYRISLRAVKLGDVDPQILDGADSLSDADGKITGTKASYAVNNSSFTSTSDSRTFSIADGVTVNLQPGATGTVDITVAPASSTLTSALASFATAYNAAADAVGAQHGQSGAALSGDTVINQLSKALSSLSTYTDPSGSINLASLGFDLGSDGHLTFNQFTFADMNAQNAAGVAAFLGSASTGGFLQSATNTLNSVEQADTGTIPAAAASAQDQITNLTNQIADQQDRVDQLQTQLQDQMSASDALIASMEQQYSYITNMFQAMQTAAQQYK